MQGDFFREHKKMCIAAGVLFLVLAGVYFYFLFQPGLWYKETFLCRQSDGSYMGSDSDFDYRMQLVRREDGGDIEFAVNENVKKYQIFSKSSHSDVQVYEDGELVLVGCALPVGTDYYWLQDENGEVIEENVITVSFDGTVEEREVFPLKNQLYTWAVSKKDDTRGNPVMLWGIVFCAGVLFVDVRFPKFFFFLEHGLSVDGGEPSDWYRFWQVVGRGMCAVGIFICIAVSFCAP